MTTRLQAGMGVREWVLGAEHVQRSLANATSFAKPMQGGPSPSTAGARSGIAKD